MSKGLQISAKKILFLRIVSALLLVGITRGLFENIHANLVVYDFAAELAFVLMIIISISLIGLLFLKKWALYVLTASTLILEYQTLLSGIFGWQDSLAILLILLLWLLRNELR